MKQIYNKNKLFGYWLLLGVGMLIIQIMLGGITRLSGSGLSITEWKIITGIIPPLNNNDWLVAFNKYQQTPQYQIINFNFTITDFKFIFFWEWLHRFWARLMGIIFLIGFSYFLYKKTFKIDWAFKLIILFILGILQGAIGWIMVASGLIGDAVYVKPIKLAVHFCFALILIGYTFWFALSILYQSKSFIHCSRKLKYFLMTIIGLLIVQLFFGALIAGYKGAAVASTWPTYNGMWIPFIKINQLFSEPITIQFIHRNLGYIIAIIIIIFSYKIRLYKNHSIFNKTKYLPIIFVFLQIILGIFSLLSSKYIVANQWGIFQGLALLHQTVAIFLFLALLHIFFLIRKYA